MGFAADLLAEIERDFARGVGATAAAFVLAVRTDPKMPEDTGKLSAGFKATKISVSGTTGEAVFESTARSSDGADYGAILDRSRGQKIVPKRKKALANVASGWGPYASSHLTTKHVGWFDAVASERNVDDAAEIGFSSVGL